MSKDPVSKHDRTIRRGLTKIILASIAGFAIIGRNFFWIIVLAFFLAYSFLGSSDD